MIRRSFIEMSLRQIYNGHPPDDATITYGLVNIWLEQGIALAAKQNYKENLAVDGISYVNGSFYSTFKGLTVTADDQFVFKVQLPQIPIGIGQNMGISTFQFKDNESRNISQPLVWITENQRTYYQNMPTIPNKLLGYSQGRYVYIVSTLLLNLYTANVTMISGGDSTDLDSELNVPSDYFPVMIGYIQQQLLLERNQPLDVQNDGADFIKTT